MNIYQNANSSNKKTNLQRINSNRSTRIEESVISKLIQETIIAYHEKQSIVDESSNSEHIKNTTPILQLFDQLGRLTPCDISSRHVCIINSCDEASINLTLNIIHTFLKADVPFEIINGSNFCKLSIPKKLDTSLKYLVMVDIDSLNIEDLCEIDSFCATKFIFKLPCLELTSGGIVQDEKLLGHLIWNLHGNFALMRRLIASLSDDEFVVVSNAGQYICCLRGIEEVLFKKSKQKSKNNKQQEEKVK